LVQAPFLANTAGRPEEIADLSFEDGDLGGAAHPKITGVPGMGQKSIATKVARVAGFDCIQPEAARGLGKYARRVASVDWALTASYSRVRSR
jgi:hypothetical protein